MSTFNSIRQKLEFYHENLFRPQNYAFQFLNINTSLKLPAVTSS